MYCNHYRFYEKPFDVTPDPRFLYLSPAHREVLASLTDGILERCGFITIVGEVGTGKTTLLNATLDRLDDKTKVAFIFNTNVTFKQMLSMALYEWGLITSQQNLSKDNAIQRLNNFAIQQLYKGGNVALIVDEAQNLDNSVMENLRLLSNLETQRHKLVQIVLSGQPELDTKLDHHELRHLAQRISLKRYIAPLSEKETYEYIQHRLSISKSKDLDILDRKAQELIWKYSNGIPRKINILCDNAFLIGYGLDRRKINADVIEEAIKDLNWIPFSGTIDPQVVVPLREPNQLKKNTSSHWFNLGGGFALVACLILIILFLLENSWISLQGDKSLFANNVIHNKTTSQPNGSGQALSKAMLEVYPQTERVAKDIIQTKQPEVLAQDGLSKLKLEQVSNKANSSFLDNQNENLGTSGSEDIQPPAHPYSLRLSCLRVEQNAHNMLISYKRNELSPYIVKVNLGKQGVWWVIYMGNYKTAEEAEKAKKDYKLIDAIVSKTPYSNLLGIFSSESEMNDKLNRLEKLDNSTYFIRKDKGTMRLFIGAFVNREVAEKENIALKAKGINSQVVER